MFKEFKKFAMRGNVIDLAVGVVIGGAFGAVIKSLVDDLLMPVLGLLLGNADFGDLFWVLREGKAIAGPYATLALAREAGAVTFNYGLFINAVVNFIIIAFAIFLLVRAINRLQQPGAAPPAPPTTKACPYCATQIPIEAARCPNCTSHL